MAVSTSAMTEPVAGAMETATAEQQTTEAGATAAGADSSSHQANTYHHHYSSMTNGNTDTSDIHDYSHQQQGLHQSQQQHQQQHNPVAIIDTGYYADIVQQPVCVCCSEYYSNGTVSHPIEPCIAVQLHRKVQLDILGSSHNTIQNTSLLVARAYLTSSDGCSDRSYFVRPLEIKVQQKVTPNHPLSKFGVVEQQYLSLQQQQASSSSSSSSSSSLVEQHIPHNQHSVPLSHNYPSSPFRRLQSTQAIRDHPSTPLVDASHPLQQSLISTLNQGSTHISFPFPSSGIDTLASLDFKTSHHPHPLSHEAPNSTDPADADHYPDNKRSVWTDITHRVLQLPLPSVPTASLFGSQTTAADIATGEDGSRGVFFSSQILALEFLVNSSSALSFRECHKKTAHIV
ncbi:hypothetical protein BASA50_004662 [Batrachochytrium salamandrivorans]|uniref:Velvet domain-containing protein n=1 Tax=Batrachochytrium salamandrivorans TaxID=1357716 RepID=A0ABQ8FI38_9FUNG|nr:hypothetical protein BASA50_004662 [Batrachochytrium salamandrivorans]